MVNAGAITCTSLIREAKGDGAFEYIRQALGRFAGRDLAVDEAVFASESATGDRNRAIAYLLRTRTSSSRTSARCWRPISGNAPFWSPRATSP